MSVQLPVYMDSHATTPVDPRVLEVMLPFFSERFGNAASRNHPFGWAAKEAVENARQQVADLIGANVKEIVFTSGATESDNLALTGVAAALRERGDHLVTAATEHRAVLDTCRHLERSGLRVTRVGVDRDGLIDPDDLQRALTERTVLISVMAANNEIGVIQPLAAIGKMAKARGILFHCDAAQAAGKIPFDVAELGVDLASLSAHKIYGPKGVGALYVRRRNPRVELEPILHGGGHERGLRSGTLNVPGIVGFGKAAEICRHEMSTERDRIVALRDRLSAGLRDSLEDTHVHGSLVHRLPHNLNIGFGGVPGEALLMAMDDIAVSSGAACTTASAEPSHVLKALGVDEDLARASIRFGLGRFTTGDEVDYVVTKVTRVVSRLREMSVTRLLSGAIVAVLLGAAGLQAQDVSDPQASASAPVQAASVAPEPLDPARLPVSLDRLRQKLAEAPRTNFVNLTGLKLETYVEVVAKAKPLEIFPKGTDLRNGPVPYGAPTHQDMLNLVTPREFRTPAMDIGALLAWLLEHLAKEPQ